jgi:hypothetical protein
VAVIRVADDGIKAYVTLHVFNDNLPKMIEVQLHEGCPHDIEDVFSDSNEEIVIEKGVLKFQLGENWKAVAVLFIEKE